MNSSTLARRFPSSMPVASLPVACLIALFVLLGCRDTPTPPEVLRLATTTSTRDSGLLDRLLPPFEQQWKVRVDVIAVGTGKALKLGEAGDVDIVLVHAREAEDAFLEAKHGVRRETVMTNQFELLGPPTDPAAIEGLEAPAALKRIAAGGFCFVSRGDDSGTHKRELRLWQKAGGRPDWSEYIETGQGMGATLIVADQMQGYVLADRGTYLKFRAKIHLTPLAAQSPDLQNPYGIIVVNPDKHPAVKAELANALVDYLISPTTQQAIADFQLAGESLFVPLRLTTPE